MARKGPLLAVLRTLLDCKHKCGKCREFAFYADCVNICLVVAGLRPGCRLECRGWDVDALHEICQRHRGFGVSSPWLYNMNPPGWFHVFFNHDAVRPVDIQTIRDERTDDSPPALAAYRRVLGYPCRIPSNNKSFRASVLMILKDTGTAALHSMQLFACMCPISRYNASMAHMERFAVKATRIMSAARLGGWEVHGFACCDS